MTCRSAVSNNAYNIVIELSLLVDRFHHICSYLFSDTGIVSNYTRRQQSWAREGRVFTGVCLSVCLFIRTISQKPLQLLDTEISHHESWKSIYFGVRRSKVKVTRHKNSTVVGLCTLVWAGFF